jgi:Uncharacterized protein conserved in bacteria
MNPSVVIEFLQEHPDFLEENAYLLFAPGEHDGNAVSLTELHMKKLREDKMQLEKQMRKLVRAGNENDATSEKMHRTTLALFMANSLLTTLEILKKTLKEDFQVPQVAVRIWGARNVASLIAVSPAVQEYTEMLDAPYCGRETTQEIRDWFIEEGGLDRGSFALLPLRTSKVFGLLALGSPDEKRFHDGMGTLFLTRLSELISVALARYLTFDDAPPSQTGERE